MDSMSLSQINFLSDRRKFNLGNLVRIHGEVHSVTDRKVAARSTNFSCDTCGLITEIQHSFPYDEEYVIPRSCLKRKGGCGTSWNSSNYTVRDDMSALFDLHIVTLKDDKFRFRLYLHGQIEPPLKGEAIVFECHPEPIKHPKISEFSEWRGASDNYEILV